MNITIIGRHPTIQPGFCGVMSLYEAKHLAELGNDVTLILPFPDRDTAQKILASKGFSSLQELPKFGGEFDIIAIYLDGALDLPSADLLIWQSIAVEDWQLLYKPARASARVVSKNFPKQVPAHPAPLSRHVDSQFKAFDLVAFALKEDMAALAQHRAFWETVSHRAAYVPRGADPDILIANTKPDFPVISLDTPNVRDNVGIEHFFGPLHQLKLDYPDLQVLSLGGDTQLEFGKALSFRPFDKMYRDFLNPAWLYCIVDYAQSAPHIRGVIHNIDRSWDDKAIYEVQTVEAQMAGSVITGFARNVIPELVNPDTSALFPDFADESQIYDQMKRAIEDFPRLSQATRHWAERGFSWKNSITDWHNAALNLIDNGYDRDRIQVPVETGAGILPNAAPAPKDISHITAALNKDEKELLFSLADGARRYVEFGCGGSTKIVSRSRVGRIECIDTNSEQLKGLELDPDLHADVTTGRLKLHHLDIGPTHEWGYPVSLDPDRCARYAKTPWTRFPLEDVDLVLVDGRFRVVTALEAALRTNDNTLIAVGGYIERPHYQVLSEVLELVQSASRMAVFQKGANWDRGKAFDLAEKYRLDAR